MRVEIRARHGQFSPIVEKQLERRLHFALARFGRRIRRISVTLEDINGPRGGEDQHCRIKVSLVPPGSIIAEATDADAASAIGRAAGRVARRVSRPEGGVLVLINLGRWVADFGRTTPIGP